jgi:hypothetical protein
VIPLLLHFHLVAVSLLSLGLAHKLILLLRGVLPLSAP